MEMKKAYIHELLFSATHHSEARVWEMRKAMPPPRPEIREARERTENKSSFSFLRLLPPLVASSSPFPLQERRGNGGKINNSSEPFPPLIRRSPLRPTYLVEASLLSLLPSEPKSLEKRPPSSPPPSPPPHFLLALRRTGYQWLSVSLLLLRQLLLFVFFSIQTSRNRISLPPPSRSIPLFLPPASLCVISPNTRSSFSLFGMEHSSASVELSAHEIECGNWKS